MWSAAMDVGEWLRALGLGQYEATIRAHEIDADVLADLTEADLEKIGLPLGARKRLLKAIANLAPNEASPAPKAPAPPLQPSARPAAPRGDFAERRPITVMFCDLVGSTSIAAKLDAEDWRSLVNAYLDEAAKAVTGLGGYVLKRLGDGLMALFGYPQAQENDAERAVRAALAIQRALAEINAKNRGKAAPELSARIGIESGPVVVEATGEVFGDAPNVAARVQAAAEPGSVVVTMNVQRQVAGLFVAEERGAHELKGVAEAVQLFRIVRASGGGRRGGARTLTPFVCREEELGLLARRWERARVGDGQLALVVGEPGLGKSRLIEEFHARLAETPHTWTEWSASQLLQNTPLHPIAEWGRQRFGMDAPAEQRLADLENTLRLVGLDPAEHAPLLAPLVDIPLPPERTASFPPEELRRRQLAAMSAWALAGARSQPLVLAIEDLHWADPTSLDLLKGLAERGAQAPLLLLATARPEFRAPWSLRSHHIVISLSPLDRAGVAQMVGEISSRHALSKEVVEGVTERTGGVPLFVEEVTRLLLERGEQGGVQAIPPTLQQSLAARLDRLGPAREVAQIGAVLGRDFAYVLLREVAEIDEPGLQASLDRLADADLLFIEGAPPQANFRFKHALIQDAAYESLLRSRREALHRRAAEVLRGDPERAVAAPEVIAHHFTQAGLDDLAIEWWGRAGDQALRRSAFQEAIAHLGKAIEMADKVEGTPSRQMAGDVAASSQRLKLQTDYGQAVMWSKGFAAEETKAAFARATELVAKTDDFSERFAALHGQWTSALVRGELTSARDLASAFLREAEEAGRVMEAGVAHRGLALICVNLGEFIEARNHCERALEACDSQRDQEARERSGEDTWTFATWLLAITSWKLGDVERARELLEAANRRATELGHGPTMASLLLGKTLFAVMRGDVSAALTDAEALEALSRRHGMALFGGWANLFVAWARGRLNDPASGAVELRQALAALADQGARILATLGHVLLAELEAETLGAERALSRIDDALTLAHQIEQRNELAFIHRLRGEIMLKRDPPDIAAAGEAFRTSIAIAKEQGARSYCLLSAIALAKLYQSTARPAEAHAALAPALDGFAPTPEMQEIAEAQALLATLAETEEVKAVAERRQRRQHLQVSYGNALIAARGFGAAETTEAFARARDAAYGEKDAPERLAADFGLWAGSYTRGQLTSMRAHAAAFLADVSGKPDLGEAGIAYCCQGITSWFAGEYLEARDHLERALATIQPGRDDDLAYRFGLDPGVFGMAYLAFASLPLGEIDRAVSFLDRMNAQIADLTHATTLAQGKMYVAQFALMRGDHGRLTENALELGRIAREHDLAQSLAFATFFEGCARARSDLLGGLENMRRGAESLRAQNILVFDGLIKIALSEAEARAGDLERAIATLDEALATVERVGFRAFEAELRRVRGEMLLRRDPADFAAAEHALQTAVATARQQGTRAFELRAALSLAKLYQSTARPAEAHAVLAPALEGFSPTPEMPEIAEVQGLLAALVATDEVKTAIAQQQRRGQLQAAYGNALLQARGLGAPETTEAFAKAREQTYGDKLAPERLAGEYGLWIGSFIRGELPSMRAYAAAFLADVGARSNSPEAVVAHRTAGSTHWFAGEYREAREYLERALALFQPERDDDLVFRFGHDAGVAAMLHLALTLWPLGDVRRAAALVGDADVRISGLAHIGARAFGRLNAALFELMRGDMPRAALNIAELAKLTLKHDLPTWRSFAAFLEGVAIAHSGPASGGLEAMRRGIELLREQNVVVCDGLFKIALAEAEARAGDVERAVAVLDEALATCQRTGHRAFEAELHRARGAMLVKCDPANPAAAEEAFRTAIAVARQQGARSFELRASLSLAKLYQSADRSGEAHAILAPALEGFSPTPEMPEIAEAQALLERLL
jgi:class 3 adenylate cyclase/predicted ATPase